MYKIRFFSEKLTIYSKKSLRNPASTL